ALTEHQIERLWRLVETPTLCFDGDAAGQRAAMRAITRALPLLRAGHSLRIATLPAGMDPDDVVKAQGPAAMEALLDEARSLVDVLWQVERDSLPLTTPEDKAGLKARLLAHCETIEHPDIKSLYRRELTERFGELAFARKERPPFQPRQGGSGPRGKGQPWKPAPPPLGAQDKARMLRIGTGPSTSLLAAVLSGLILQPQFIAHHADALARLHPEDADFCALIDALLIQTDTMQALESEALRTILLERGLRLPSAQDYAGMRFGFLASSGDSAGDELAEAVALLVELPAVEEALEHATKRHETEFSDETFAEQQRLRKRRVDLFARLEQMNRARAAL
ncbi:MAG: DNA primase, partial [Novosphingobium sp. 35-62-5]